MKSPKRLFWLIPFIILFIVLAIPLLPVYNIKEIEVRSEFSEMAVEIAKASGLKTGSNIFISLLTKGNIFTMRLTEAEQNITEKFMHFSNISVSAELPARVLIEYSTKEQAFEIEYGGIYLVTDINGCVLETRASHELGFVRITGMDIDGFAMGCVVGNSDGKFEDLAEIYESMKWYDEINLTAFREYIEWIDISNNAYIAMMYDGRILVKLDYDEDIWYQTAYMCKILSQQIGSSEEGVLDFTAGENPVFSPD
ncbi:MAG: hypothetical protein R6W99_00480 [Clostridia bacterium]